MATKKAKDTAKAKTTAKKVEKVKKTEDVTSSVMNDIMNMEVPKPQPKVEPTEVKPAEEEVKVETVQEEAAPVENATGTITTEEVAETEEAETTETVEEEQKVGEPKGAVRHHLYEYLGAGSQIPSVPLVKDTEVPTDEITGQVEEVFNTMDEDKGTEEESVEEEIVEKTEPVKETVKPARRKSYAQAYGYNIGGWNYD